MRSPNSATHFEGNTSLFRTSKQESHWVLLVNEGNMKGANIVVDDETGEVFELSTRQCNDEDRWTIMPSLESYPSLELVDLDNSRYITELHESITTLSKLKKLVLTRCVGLERLPASLGRLQNLQEVRKNNTVGRRTKLCTGHRNHGKLSISFGSYASMITLPSHFRVLV